MISRQQQQVGRDQDQARAGRDPETGGQLWRHYQPTNERPASSVAQWWLRITMRVAVVPWSSWGLGSAWDLTWSRSCWDHSQHSCSSSATSRHQVEKTPAILKYFNVKTPWGHSPTSTHGFSETLQPGNNAFRIFLGDLMIWRSCVWEGRQLVWFGGQVIGLVFLYIFIAGWGF